MKKMCKYTFMDGYYFWATGTSKAEMIRYQQEHGKLISIIVLAA